MHTSRFCELFENQDIVLIGGAPDIEIPEELDEPFIIGTNQHQQGKIHTDGIVCCACEPAKPELWPERMEFMAVPRIATYRDDYIGEAIKKKTRTVIDYPIEITIPSGRTDKPDDEWAETLMRQLKCRPFTGIFALAWLMKFPFKSLHLTGFTFYYNERRKAFPVSIGNHDIRQQLEYVRELYNNDSRISADTKLEVILCEGVTWPDFPLKYLDIASKVVDCDPDDPRKIWKEVPYSKWIQKNVC